MKLDQQRIDVLVKAIKVLPDNELVAIHAFASAELVERRLAVDVNTFMPKFEITDEKTPMANPSQNT